MKAGYRFPAERNDMIDFMLDAGLLRKRDRFVVELQNLRAMLGCEPRQRRIFLIRTPPRGYGITNRSRLFGVILLPPPIDCRKLCRICGIPRKASRRYTLRIPLSIPRALLRIGG